MATSLLEIYDDMKITPKIRMATLLFETGVVKTKAEAAEMVGISRAHFYNMTNLNGATRHMANEIQSMVKDESVATSKILQIISRKAIGKLDQLMDSGNETIAFRAAQDLADRGPETQKTQKLQVESLTITGEDARALAAAMVESAQVQKDYRDVGVHGLIEVDTDKAPDLSALRLLPRDT